MRAATEWKVPSHGMPSIAPPLIADTRSFISRAALLVKVTLENLAWPRFASRDQMGEAGGQRGGLAGAGAGKHQHWSFGGQHRFALRRVQAVQIGGFGREGRGFRHASEVGGGERIGNQCGRIAVGKEKVPMVVTDIPVIHRLFPEIFRFPNSEPKCMVHG